MLDRLEDSFQRLARFSSDIAHELRTPVNNLRGEAEVALQRTRSADEYREVLGSCLEECARLTGLIDNLLFLARAEHPESTIQRIELDVVRELHGLRDYYEAAATEAGIELHVAAAGSVHFRLDITLFQRAAGNLIANALVHTPRGGTVTLGVCLSENSLSVSVADTGAGIAPEHLPFVFDRFYRGDKARTSGGGRVGLGLAIVKSIMTLHQGTVQLESVLGKGTRVTLTFPDLQKLPFQLATCRACG
jgi:two-component system heavy metal sensor histidine kinase CusS